MTTLVTDAPRIAMIANARINAGNDIIAFHDPLDHQVGDAAENNHSQCR